MLCDLMRPHVPKASTPRTNRSGRPVEAEGIVKSREKGAGARLHGAARVASALFVDRELLPANHIGPFLGLRLDVIGELLRCASHRFEHLRREEFFAEVRVGEDLLNL